MPQDNKDKKNNNFFNQNPLVIFAIFSVLIILIFKTVVEPTDNMGSENTKGFAATTTTQNINYYEFKQMIKEGKIKCFAASGSSTISL